MCKEETEACPKQPLSIPLGSHKDCEKCVRIASLLVEIETWNFPDVKQEYNDCPIVLCRIKWRVKLS